MTQALRLTKTEQKLIDGLDDAQSHLKKKLWEWSSQNSGTQNRSGLEKMRAMIGNVFSELPGDITDAPLTPGEFVTPNGEVTTVEYEPAFKLQVRPDADVQLVLTGHYDTVFPKDYHFQAPKLLEDEIMGGPGTADMKGGLLVMFNALRTLERSDHASKIGYTVLVSPDEEIGSPGSAPLLAELGKRSHVGLTFEPALADGSMAGARKGSGNFALIVRGKAAHAGREHHLGRNAIAALSRFIMGLETLNGQRDGVTFNIAKIDGGGAPNIVPELAIGRFNVRMKESADMAWITAEMDKLVAQVNAQDGISAEMTGGFTRPPKPMAPANAKVFGWVKQAGDLLGQDIKWSPSGGVCEGNNLWASGCPNVDTLGVRGANIHSDREYMVIPSLTERSRLSALILMKLASGEFDAVAAKKLAGQH